MTIQTFAPSNTNAVFLPTTIQYPKDPNELLIRLNKAYEDTATRLNVKQIGIFDLVEFLTGEQWFTTGNPQVKRQTFRIVFEFSDASLVFNHGITGITLCTHIYGGFTDGTIFYPLPYVDVVNVTNQVKVTVSATQVLIVKGATAPAITNGVVILEYLKN